MRNPGASDLEKVATKEKLPVTVLPMDVDNDALVVEVFKKMGDSIDVLVNNAGIYSINVVEDEDLEQFRRVMETNFFGAWSASSRCCRRCGSGARDSIINVSLIAGRIAFSSTSAYNAIEVRPGGVQRVPSAGGERLGNQDCPCGARHY